MLRYILVPAERLVIHNQPLDLEPEPPSPAAAPEPFLDHDAILRLERGGTPWGTSLVPSISPLLAAAPLAVAYAFRSAILHLAAYALLVACVLLSFATVKIGAVSWIQARVDVARTFHGLLLVTKLLIAHISLAIIASVTPWVQTVKSIVMRIASWDTWHVLEVVLFLFAMFVGKLSITLFNGVWPAARYLFFVVVCYGGIPVQKS